MSDRFQPIRMEQLVSWVFAELKRNDAIFGIPRRLFFVPGKADPFAVTVYGRRIETPYGVAAGPHSQMAQNIIAAWLCGARFIELKTVQTLDEIEVSKPCIDMLDEGYNCEWSQELKVRQSFDEYLRAWVLIHALHRELGFAGEMPGVIFNLSVGYNMEGLLKPNMQEYLRLARDAGPKLQEYADIAAEHCPAAKGIAIPACLSDNVTLSTMHGCPPDEIEKISRYLIDDCGLHTSVKLNPTLLGPETLRRILNRDLGFKDVSVPDLAFEHDLKYEAAIPMLKRLGVAAVKRGVQFGVKLSNTLEVANHRPVFPKHEKTMYMSGRALHAVTVNLAAKLGSEFDGQLMTSFSGGVDAFNAHRLLACGMKTVTVCSDLLKPGSYIRIQQYLENTTAAIRACGASDIRGFILKSAGERDGVVASSALANLLRYAQETLDEPRLKKNAVDTDRTKTSRALGPFDCIKAPCTDECAIDQKVPEYMNLVRDGRIDEAIDLTRDDNPLAAILGRACNHACESVCVRTHYDAPLAIREIKRFIMDQEKQPHYRQRAPGHDVRVAVVGGGPCGLSVGYFLSQAGYQVTIFESRPYAGGMVSGSIPGYRATNASIEQDMEIIRKLGVEILYGKKAGRDFTLEGLRGEGFKYVAVAAGAQQGLPLGIPGEDMPGVLDGLEFLRAAREKRSVRLGPRVGVIGGGDVAMDCARTAARLTDGKVTLVYRRTMDQMPAQREELSDTIGEGVGIQELAAPNRIVADGGRLKALRCTRMELGESDDSGRRRPVEVPNSEFDIPLDHVIVAIGQRADLSFFGDQQVALTSKGYILVDPQTMETSIPGVFAGGDIVMNGPETIVQALGDGRNIARSIRAREEGKHEPEPKAGHYENVDVVDMIRRRSRREPRVHVPHLPFDQRRNFNEVVQPLSVADATREAQRCLDCHKMCSLCVAVCPNLAFITYRSVPFAASLPQLRAERGALTEVGSKPFAVEQRFQVAVLSDFCNECGNCVTFCPTSGRPYQDKPRLYLSRPEFDAQRDNAFMLFQRGDGWGMRGRFGGASHEIVLNGALTYTSPQLSACIDPSDFSLQSASLVAGSEGDTHSLEPCAQMYVLLKSLRDSMPHLPVADS
ncbi:MAG: putative selenate reductase subunit YgfK [Caldimonas sp.]